jgi:hypothetical protein
VKKAAFFFVRINNFTIFAIEFINVEQNYEKAITIIRDDGTSIHGKRSRH